MFVFMKLPETNTLGRIRPKEKISQRMSRLRPMTLIKQQGKGEPTKSVLI